MVGAVNISVHVSVFFYFELPFNELMFKANNEKFNGNLAFTEAQKVCPFHITQCLYLLLFQSNIICANKSSRQSVKMLRMHEAQFH